MRGSRWWSGRQSCLRRLARLVGAGLGAVVLLGGGARESPAASYLHGIHAGGQLINESSGTASCWQPNDSYYYATYTDSRYHVGTVAHYFLLLDSTFPPVSWWALTGTLTTVRRGILVTPHCPTLSPCACEGQVGSQLFQPHETSTGVPTSYPFTRLSGYAEYADLVRALGGTPQAEGSWVAFGYVAIDLSAAGGAHTVTDVRFGLPGCGQGCPTNWQWVAPPYEAHKSFSDAAAVVVPEEHCHDGADNNANGLIDETCWGDGPEPQPSPAPPIPSNNEPTCSTCNLASGNLTDTIPLLAFAGGPAPLAFSVTYNSLDTLAGALGRGWTHSLWPYVRDVSATKLVLVNETGGWTEYRNQGGERYAPLNRPARDQIVKLADGRFERTWPDGRRWRFNAGGQLLEQHDRNGHVVRYTYTGGVLTQVEDPSGHTVAFTYDANGRITRVEDSAGRAVTFDYDPADPNHLRTIHDAAGGRWDFTYDASGRMLTKTDPRGQVVRYGYTSGRLTSVTDPANVTRQFSYDFVHKATRITEPDGATRLQTWSGRINAPLAVTDASGRTTTYGYRSSGHLCQASREKGPLGIA